MKPAPFDYVRAGSVEEACALLAAPPEDGEAKILAGGQTLVPMMAMRLARPALVVDINEIDALKGIAVEDDAVVVRAGTRQRAAETSPELAEHAPLLVAAIRHVGHQQTRNRGTVGGSLANADPSAEIGLAALALEAEVTAASTRGARRIALKDFFHAPLVTALAVDECLTELRIPRPRAGARVGAGFAEMTIRRGDFAIAAAAVRLEIDGDGVCTRAVAAIGGAGAAPTLAAAAAAALAGGRLDEGAIAAAASRVGEDIQPGGDMHASAAYRGRVAAALFARATRQAAAEARP